jgi:hypothetical protein
MVDFARKIFPGELHKSVFTIFMEATINTIEHASNTNQRILWVAGAYFDEGKDVICYTVIDQGVGILNSVRFRKDLGALWGRVTWNAGEKLRQLLLGKMRSRTSEPHRGKGLPGAYEALKDNRIEDLAIITNTGFAHAGADRFLEVDGGFDGTIIYWEVKRGSSRPNETEHQR